MKALHLVKTAVGATWALRQMRELVTLGVDVHVAMPAGGPLQPLYEQAQIKVHSFQSDFPTRRPWTIPSVFTSFRSLVQAVNPDIIHSHFVGTTLTARLALGKASFIPRIFQVPGPLHLEHPFFRRAELAVSSQADFWVASCKWTQDRYIQSGIEPERVHLSYYGVDADVFTPQQQGALRQELGIPTDERIVGMVAYMYAPKRYLGQTRGLKGHEDLIDAMALCLRSQPAIRCVFIGGPWNGADGYEEQVRAYARLKLGDRAIFLGTRYDIPQLYADFDVVVHPSHSENVGGAVESLLLAVPTITTSVGGFPDIVRPGTTGWLVAPKQPAQLAATILDALQDPVHARRMAAAGQALTRAMFDVRHTAQGIFQIYEYILQSRHRRYGSSRS